MKARDASLIVLLLAVCSANLVVAGLGVLLAAVLEVTL